MKLFSPNFSEGQAIPAKFTCDGENINPALEISDVPTTTKSLALIVEDPDAPSGTFIHWILWNIPPETKSIKESSYKTGYIGPCPPSGTHHYIFTLYALDKELNLPSPPTASVLRAIMKDHILDQAQMIGVYSRTKK